MSNDETYQDIVASFRDKYGFPPLGGKRVGVEWVKQQLRNGLVDHARFAGVRFDRITAKVGLLRSHLQSKMLNSTRVTYCSPLREIWCLLETTNDDAAVARYFLSRVPCPELLDVQDMTSVNKLYLQRQDLDATRADVHLDYKIFVALKRGCTKKLEDQAGSYSGLAFASTGAQRSSQHMAAFEKAVKGTVEGENRSQHLLYDPRAVVQETRFVIATNVDIEPTTLMSVWAFATGTPWPFTTSTIQRLTASMDEMLLCLEFEDAKPVPGIGTLERQGLHLVRKFKPLNAQFPAGVSARRRIGAAHLSHKRS